MATLVDVAILGWPGHMRDLSHFFVSFCFLRHTASRPGRICDRSGQCIRQIACFRPRMCLSGVSTISDYIFGVKPPKFSKMSLNRHFHAQTTEVKNPHISKTLVNRLAHFLRFFRPQRCFLGDMAVVMWCGVNPGSGSTMPNP